MRRDHLAIFVAVLVTIVLTAFLGAFAINTVAGAEGGAPSLQSSVNNTTDGYTVRELSRSVSHSGAPSSVRRWGDDGQLWLRHVPVGMFVRNNPDTSARYIDSRTTVNREVVYLGSFRGWTAPSERVRLHIVTWNKGTEVRTGPNGTSRVVEVPVNVSERVTTVTLAGSGYDRATVELPEFYDDRKRVTMWVEGKRDSVRWTFHLKTSKAAESIPVGTLGGVIKWSMWHVFLWVVLVAGLLVGVSKKLIEKGGKGAQWGPLEYGFIGFACVFLGGFIFYRGIMDTLARRPQLIGVLGGLFLGGLVIRALAPAGEEALFLQPKPKSESADTDGSGSWHWANRVHTVVEREKDGKKVIPRPGWIPFFARVWPGYDAAPVLEFEATEDRVLTSPPEDVEFAQDDAGVWERIRTQIVGKDEEGDEYDTIYLIDPLADDVIEYDEEGFSLSLPSLVSWPEDEESGTWIRGVPLPSIAFGKMLGGTVVVVLVGVLVTIGVASALWGVVASLVALLALLARPVEGAARVQLAPAHFDAVLGNIVATLEGWSERADADYFRARYHESDARRRVERTQERERDQRSVFAEVNERLAPTDASTNTTASQTVEEAHKEASADD